MILAISERHKRAIAFVFLFLFYAETVTAAAMQLKNVQPLRLNEVSHHYKYLSPVAVPAITAIPELQELALPFKEVPEETGPSQPEMQQFSSVNSSDMVDLFTGDFSYNIPLLDVGGYPVNIAYRGGVTMDQEASWVGLGWNVNPGTITRNLRGLPDDFNGKTDTITKTAVVKENKTIGVTAGADIELKGTRLPVRVGGDLGVFHNNYKGWGMELGLDASINSGSKASGFLSGGLSFTDNSQDGVTFSPTFSATLQSKEGAETGGYGSVTIGSSYNSRAGLSGLQLSTGLSMYTTVGKNKEKGREGFKVSQTEKYSSNLSFAYPSFLPSITMPYTSRQYSFTAKVGNVHMTFDPNFFISGYVSTQTIDEKDRVLALPAYGYLNYQNSNDNIGSALDFNREKDIPYREKPAIPHIAIPSYTYDVFSISGEGTGGAFRAYRGDIGYIRDNNMRTNDGSDRFSADVSPGNLAHVGTDLNFNRSVTQTGPWKDHPLAKTLAFRSSGRDFEAAYFRNPGEKAINTKEFYQAIGGDDVVVPELFQQSSFITTTGRLNKYNKQKLTGSIPLGEANVTKPKRDKRTQVISYLTAEEADKVGMTKYIENRKLNVFRLSGSCDATREDKDEGDGSGLIGEYFNNTNLSGQPVKVVYGENINRTNIGNGAPFPGVNNNYYSARWTGRIKAPVTGTYEFANNSDDGMRVWINDVLVIDDWNVHPAYFKPGLISLNLLAGEVNTIKVEYFEDKSTCSFQLLWKYPGQDWQVIPAKNFYYQPQSEIFPVGTPEVMTREKRVNSFRKKTHISEINVLNQDGRKYVYGIPVYNFKQREATFSVERNAGNAETGLARFVHGSDNTVNNNRGRDNYFNAEDLPAYAHTFLLTGIVSSDYVDLTNNGISDDDLGDAVKFNYTRTAGVNDALEWRIPFAADSATYNEGLRTDNRDDKASYVCGTRENWYLQTIESKNMVAAFFLDNTNRLDGVELGENGVKKASSKIKRLRKISVYNKSEFLEKDTAATPVKTVYFEYSYELCPGFNKPVNDSGKLTLKKIWFSYNGNNKGRKNAYVFTYHANNPAFNSKSYDRWGNYKHAANNPSTSGVISNADYPYVVQDSTQAASNVAAWSLTQIKLPSGGIIKADYESDDYAYVQDKRAMQMCKLAGLGTSADWNTRQPGLYTNSPMLGVHEDHLYAFIKVPVPVTSVAQIKPMYLDGIEKLYFRMYVQMPSDKWGNGYEYVPCYADIDEAAGFDFSGDMIRVKLKGIHRDGELGGNYSPLAKAAVQFLRMNLPSKAYPGSEVGDNLNPGDAVRIILTMFTNIVDMMQSFDEFARGHDLAKNIDLNRSLVRVTCPTYKRLGGGSRVKRITVYDSWYKMTQQKEATYGQEYRYTTTREVNGVKTNVSSGVAAYEPGIGGEENPFHLPIEYTQRVAPLAPVNLGYTEEPLGEGFFPAPTVGYSKVRVRSIHTDKKRSANGYQETCFYTAYDFPTSVDWTLIDTDTKKRYRSPLGLLTGLNISQSLTVAQGFKIELNDMHGKLRSTASYAENDPENFISYSEQFYKVENAKAIHKQLNNTVMAIAPDGQIDADALIGKDVELMMDMREQRTVANGTNVHINVDVIPSPPLVIPIPSRPTQMQRQDTRYRSIGTTKIIQRYGIIDSVVTIDKGSRVTTRNLLFDSETGDVLLTSVQNEFKDPVYNFTYPTHWAYDGMGLAYKNIDAVFNNIFIKNGRLTSGLPNGAVVTDYFASGDEMLVASKVSISSDGCNDIYTSFPTYTRVWAVDANAADNGTPDLYFVDKDGHAFGGNDISLKIIRSGRRNTMGAVGAVTCLVNPLVPTGNGGYTLQLNTASKVLNASVAHYKQVWKVADKRKSASVETLNCQTCCLRYLMEYLFSFDAFNGDQIRTVANPITVQQLVQNANNAGFRVDINCDLLYKNRNGLFYHHPVMEDYDWFASHGEEYYRFQLGDALIRIVADSLIYLENQEFLNFRNCLSTGTRVELTDQYPTDSCFTYDVPINMNSGADSIRQRFTRPCDGVYYDTVNNVPEVPKVPIVPVYRINRLGNAEDRVVIIYSGSSIQTYSDYIPATLVSVSPNPLPDTNVTVGHLEMLAGCDTVTSSYCFSAITDTVVNPYVYGLLGNFRADTTYTYYGNRTTGNIRYNGAFTEFVPFWQFNNGKLRAYSNADNWAWTSSATLYNVKGNELENKDPLNRYNAGLYGYNVTLPVAVAQNARYNETAFDGFEDYFFRGTDCMAECNSSRHIDFSSFSSNLTTEESHSGLYSLKITPGNTVNIAAPATSGEAGTPQLQFNTAYSSCSGNYLQSLKTDSSSLLPAFSPLKGSKVVFSTWVKESKDCKCETYAGNQVWVGIATSSGSSTHTLTPQGTIIEGWQRYEAVIDIPLNATAVSFSFRATGESNVYFDDIRVHPYHANMKSFVYHPINLRLMAELDENNYATFYEYDDDGTLMRVKKETQRGIKTIKETRSALRIEE